MPATAPIADFTRRQSEVIERLRQTGEPLYLTRNGRAAVVVMDADAYDRQMARREELRRAEEDVYAGIIRGYRDVLEGHVSDLDAMDARVRTARGW